MGVFVSVCEFMGACVHVCVLGYARVLIENSLTCNRTTHNTHQTYFLQF